MITLAMCYGTDGTVVRGFYQKECGKWTTNTEYKSFEHAKARCRNPNHVKYPRYGARGIEFRFANFSAFCAELGQKPTPKHTIDRIDNEGHYEVGNVRWATQQEQQENRSDVHPVELTFPDGSTKRFPSMTAAARGSDISKHSVRTLCIGEKEIIKGYKAKHVPR